MPWSIKQKPFVISWLTLGGLALVFPILAFIGSRASNHYKPANPYQGYVPLNQRVNGSGNSGGNRRLTRKMYEGAYGDYGGGANGADYSNYYHRGEYAEAGVYGANQYNGNGNQYNGNGNQYNNGGNGAGNNAWGGNGQDLYQGEGNQANNQAANDGQQQQAANNGYNGQQNGYNQQAGGNRWDASSMAQQYNRNQFQQGTNGGASIYGSNCYDWKSCQQVQDEINSQNIVNQAHANGDTVDAPSWWLWGTEDSEEKTGLVKFIVFVYFCSLVAFGYILKWGFDKSQTGSVEKLKRVTPLLFGSAAFSFMLYLIIGAVDGVVMFDTVNAYEHGFYGQSAVLAMFTFLLWSIFALCFATAIHFHAICFSYTETIDDYEIHSDPEKAEISKPVNLGRTLTTPASMFSKGKSFFKKGKSPPPAIVEE